MWVRGCFSQKAPGGGEGVFLLRRGGRHGDGALLSDVILWQSPTHKKKTRSCSAALLPCLTHSQKLSCGFSRELARNTFFFFFFHLTFSLLGAPTVALAWCSSDVPGVFSLCLLCFYLRFLPRPCMTQSSRCWPSSWVTWVTKSHRNAGSPNVYVLLSHPFELQAHVSNGLLAISP